MLQKSGTISLILLFSPVLVEQSFYHCCLYIEPIHSYCTRESFELLCNYSSIRYLKRFNMKKRGKNTRYKRQRFVYKLITLFGAIIFPTNCSGNPLRQENPAYFVCGPNEELAEKNMLEKQSVMIPQHTNEDGQQQNLIKISFHFVLFSIFAMILSTLFLTLILRYLKNIFTAKRSLLICLYEDTMKIFLCLEWLYLASLLTCYLSDDDKLNNKPMAEVFCYCTTFLSILLLLTLNCLSILELYHILKLEVYGSSSS